MRKLMLLAASAALCLTGCAHMSADQCGPTIDKVQRIRGDLQAAQLTIAAICTTGVASKECREEIQIAARIHAALDLAVALAASVCPAFSLGGPTPVGDPPKTL